MKQMDIFGNEAAVLTGCAEPLVEGAALLSAPPEMIIREAVERHQPIRTYCLFSGGNDSSVLAHRCRDFYDELAFIDTGTALPGVRDFVEASARRLGKPLRIFDAGDAFRRLVLGGDEFWARYRAEAVARPHLTWQEWVEELKAMPRPERVARGLPHAPVGFPGPAGHGFAYQRLKERQIETLVRETKRELAPGRRVARVGLLTGVRVHESGRRRMTTTAQGFYERRGNQLWINPLYGWTNEDMRAYRQRHDLPQSDVAALIHRSGECNCGAFSSPGEREMLKSMYPRWFAQFVEPLEQEAALTGIPACRWGERPPGETKVGEVGPMCSDCQLRLDVDPS